MAWLWEMDKEEEGEGKTAGWIGLRLAIYDDIDHHCGSYIHTARSKRLGFARPLHRKAPRVCPSSHKVLMGSYRAGTCGPSGKL